MPGRSTASRARALVELARPGNAAMAAVGALVGALVAVEAVPWRPVALAAGATALVTAGGNALNDAADRRVDRAAHPERPIPSGRASAGAAVALAAACFALALPMAWAAAPRVFLLVVAAEAGLLGYEGAWKARGLVGNAVVGLLVGATVVAGGLAAGRVTAPVGFLAALAMLSTVGREIDKDAEDAAHDRGRDTLAHRLGAVGARRVAAGFTLAAVALSAAPLVVGFGGWPFLALVALADLGFVAAVLQETPARAQRLSKAAMGVALVAFAVGGAL